MKLTMIAAVAANRTIGLNNDIPWKLSSDLKHFKRTTLGSTMILGRKTFESFGSRPLPKRNHIIVTSKPMTLDPDWGDSVFVAHSIDEAIGIAQKITTGEVFVIGGATIYDQMIDRATGMILTELQEGFEGDTFFPEFNRADWYVVSEHQPDDAEVPYVIRVYQRG